ncbi:hypothetical protein BS47DRAFT_1322283 [Hydnum rufescens UP504]|uniref:DNA mismatch repair proteins mutS family domain-containing protein n=1 Tax=Hydnum rufescens UP504 TaxID=1448309 RepID=A0A9P6AH35_9AGAM|nr:hypothetical protein BS47DRAFT_1322283 [Hydnum rufescens UP504]
MSVVPSRSGSVRRPSSRPVTAASNPQNGYVIAIYENRGVGREIGIASLDRSTGRATILQISDCQTYVKTLHHLHVHYPSVVVVLDSSLPSDPSPSRRSTVLVQYIQEDFPDVPMESVSRKYWNDTVGLEFITMLMVDDEERASTILSVSNNPFALCAAAALFKYVQTKLSTIYSPRSLRIHCRAVEGTMMIDHDTAKNLELGGNMANKKSKHSLFGLLNHVFTPMGARSLRVNILAPPTVQGLIESRLNAVDELVRSEDHYTSIKVSIKAMNKIDIDKLISSIIVATPNYQTNNPKEASSHVTNMLLLRNVVRSIPAIQRALQGCESALLRIIQGLLSDEKLFEVERLLASSLNDDATLGKKTGLPAANSKVYAVKANFNRMLDVARETYKENVSDIFELNRTLSEEHNLPLALTYQERGGGFWFTVSKDDLEDELPRGFLNVTARGAKWFFTSMELKKRNARMKDALEEALMLSDRIIQDLVLQVVENIGIFYKASEAISLLDMLWAFSHVAILHSYVRPEFTGTLAIKAGRHPILENLQSAGTFVANDTYACESSTFQIVQGPNMSGKSTYLRQLGLLTVMATCGCFVPAEYASFRVHDALLTRLSNDDDPERNLSTFSNEMASSAMILSMATPNSMVLIDELGRGTSAIEGLGIAHAIAENLIDLKAFVFFATHFSDLSATLSRRPSVVNLHLSVQNNTQSSSSHLGLQFHYRLLDGRGDDIPHYGAFLLLTPLFPLPGPARYVFQPWRYSIGLELARLADLPKEAMEHARGVAEKLTDLDKAKQAASKTSQAIARRKAVLRLQTQLTQAYEHSALPDHELSLYLARLQKEIVAVLGSVLDE